MSILNQIKQSLPGISNGLAEAIAAESTYATYSANTELLREGQYVKVIPLVLSGTVKVMADFDEKELLLYYIRPSQSCAMSFSAALHHSPSQVKAITTEESELILLPGEAVNRWTKEFDDFNKLFFEQYQLRYSELLNTIQSLLFGRMDQRLLDYLKTKAQYKPEGLIKLAHREIATELGTVREVISRVIKKLENEGLVLQTKEGIRVLSQ